MKSSAVPSRRDKWMRKPLILCIFCGLLSAAEPGIEPPDKLFSASEITLAGAAVADAASSWGLTERNPMLGNQFDSRSVAIKAGITGAVLLAERRALHNCIPEECRYRRRIFKVINFVAAGGYSAAAVWNSRQH